MECELSSQLTVFTHKSDQSPVTSSRILACEAVPICSVIKNHTAQRFQENETRMNMNDLESLMQKQNPALTAGKTA